VLTKPTREEACVWDRDMLAWPGGQSGYPYAGKSGTNPVSSLEQDGTPTALLTVLTQSKDEDGGASVLSILGIERVNESVGSKVGPCAGKGETFPVSSLEREGIPTARLKNVSTQLKDEGGGDSVPSVLGTWQMRRSKESKIGSYAGESGTYPVSLLEQEYTPTAQLKFVLTQSKDESGRASVSSILRTRHIIRSTYRKEGPILRDTQCHLLDVSAPKHPGILRFPTKVQVRGQLDSYEEF